MDYTCDLRAPTTYCPECDTYGWAACKRHPLASLPTVLPMLVACEYVAPDGKTRRAWAARVSDRI